MARRWLVGLSATVTLRPALVPVGLAVAGDEPASAGALRMVAETYAGDLGLTAVTGVGYSPGPAELLAAGTGPGRTGAAVVGISRIGDVAGCARLARGVAAPEPRRAPSSAGPLRHGTTAGLSSAPQGTEDPATIVREIVGRPGWTSGNAVAPVISGTGTRTADPVEGGAPPVLHLVYQRQNG